MPRRAKPPQGEPLVLVVPPAHAGARLDWFLAQQLPAYSRTHLRRVINAAQVRIAGRRCKAAHRVQAGERVEVYLPELPRTGPVPEPIPLEIVYEDEDLVVVNKPAGMVVHPGRGNWRGTLAGALQYHFNELSTQGGPSRPGLVHRLDRDTSGLLVVARHDQAHAALAEQFASRSVHKEYLAICCGQPERDRDWIDLPIGIHPYQREKMAVRKEHPHSRPAQSFYEVCERFRGFSLLRLLPKTGRTHQLRVHLASIGCPVLCDKQYGGRSQITLGELSGSAADGTVLLARQALHACRLKLRHPLRGHLLEFEVPLPADMQAVIAALREYRRL
ncbi:MAG: RluA family pseudouridine synthase [Pirellulales bacterium]|nr:RluA family pseudouridine synthase [Pirellulales bacterium]